jgi:serine/threonine protein kinase
MRYIPGRMLAQVSAEEDTQLLERVVTWMEQGGSALDCVHEQRVLRRDVKPGNTLLDRKDRAVVTRL